MFHFSLGFWDMESCFEFFFLILDRFEVDLGPNFGAFWPFSGLGRGKNQKSVIWGFYCFSSGKPYVSRFSRVPKSAPKG